VPTWRQTRRLTPSNWGGRRAPLVGTLRSMDRWSLSDKQLYGAEDDDDMDAIMNALDKFTADEGDPDTAASN
jgi:hypothetical protein